MRCNNSLSEVAYSEDSKAKPHAGQQMLGSVNN